MITKAEIMYCQFGLKEKRINCLKFLIEIVSRLKRGLDDKTEDLII